MGNNKDAAAEAADSDAVRDFIVILCSCLRAPAPAAAAAATALPG